MTTSVMTGSLSIHQESETDQCENILLIWGGMFRRRIIGEKRCVCFPVVAHVTLNCSRCGYHHRGHWCRECFDANELEYRHNPLYCYPCNDFTVKFESRRIR